MKDLRSLAVGALCFCVLARALPQVDALNTREGQAHALEASIQQRVALAQKEMQANAMALAIETVEGGLKDEIVKVVKGILTEFSKSLVNEFSPTFEGTCSRVAHEAAAFSQGPHENDGVNPADYAFAQLKETVLTKDACDTSPGMSFKPTGRVTGSFLEQRKFWDAVKGAIGGMKVLAGPLMEKMKTVLGRTLKDALKKFVGPQLKEEVTVALESACNRALEEEEEEALGAQSHYNGHPGDYGHADGR